uniref:Glutathione S-transferase n=1 Tax=Argyresthia conjugella TaxID=687015 RepID=H9N4S5_9NEOP|nr:glutathione S-transferase [Argyresthia conjugella]
MKGLILTIVFVANLACNAAARSKTSKMPADRIKLYHLPPSPPCRAVRMLAMALNLELELVMTNLMEGEHLKPEFLKMNPQHTLPTIDDNGFILWESRAIMAYLVNAYGRDDSLYPKNPRLRAVVDQRLNFDVGTLYARYIAYYAPVLFFGQEKDEEKQKKLDEAIGWFNSMLEGRTFSAGDNLTIADITIIVTFSTLEALEYDFSEYENVQKWYERTKKALEPYGYKEIDEAGAQMLGSFVKKD